MKGDSITKFVNAIGAGVLLCAVGTVVADSGLSEEEITTLDQFCGTSGWHDATDDKEATIYIWFPAGNGPANLEPSCLVVRRDQSIHFEVAGGKTAEIRFPGRSPFSEQVLKVGAAQDSIVPVDVTSNCPLSKQLFGCKYDVAEAGNPDREVLDPTVVIKGGGQDE